MLQTLQKSKIQTAGSKVENRLISFQNVSKFYGQEKTAAISNVSFKVARGEFVCFVGPSGSGKSTVLKIIAGLEKETTGKVLVPEKVAMVFQSGALFPWLNVFDNIALGLRSKNENERKVTEEVRKYTEMLQLEELENKYPRDLSGGQRQRVGIARALAVSPQVLLLDEPFSALDIKTTEELHRDVLKIWKATGQTIVMISHSIEEAVVLAEKVFLIKAGKLEASFNIALPRPRREQEQGFDHEVMQIRKEFFK